MFLIIHAKGKKKKESKEILGQRKKAFIRVKNSTHHSLPARENLFILPALVIRKTTFIPSPLTKF